MAVFGHREDMERTPSDDLETGAALEGDIHRALVQLYDPDKLGRSPLLAAFGVRHTADPAMALRL